ncbi:MAG TPA: carboxypeptidase regulatory-like domain-containing protein [Blastocatellia bacterium]|nr:carboxypeptidase regulatory-like domain-containing protein [Blastocatellia bacterium]
MNKALSQWCRTKPLLSALLFTLLATGTAFSQDLATKGSIAGRVVDATGAVIPNAKVIISGPTGERSVTANESGEFEATNLIPGRYNVRAEQSGFKTVTVPNVEVFVGKVSSLRLTLQAGNVSEVVEVSAGTATIDTSSTAVGANLNDQLYQNLPLQRSVTSLFYLSPGATDSLLGGAANPSISGGSALDNLYIADGVNITDSAFGGLGVFSRSYGTLGVGINTSYIKEVQVKTGGFEPQYGQSQGGIVNIITKSGGNDYHGSIFGYASPKSFEAERRQPDDLRINKYGKLLHDENYDAGGEFGGHVPSLKDKMFFFGSFNPTVRREIVRGADGSGLRTLLGDTARRYRTLNYAFKLDYNLTPSHQVNFSIFGDPTTTNTAPFRTVNIDNATSNSRLELGTRNIAVRYNGSLSSTWTVSGSFNMGRNTFDETGFDNFNRIIDRTNPTRGNFTAIGLGFFEPTESNTYRATFDTSKQVTFLGTHTFGLGYQYQRSFYSGTRDRSGPKYTIPATNVEGTSIVALGGSLAAGAIGQQMNAEWSLRTAGAGCTLCPLLNVPGTGDVRVYLRQDRGEYGVTNFDSRANYHAGYIQDTWRMNRFITVLAGLRHEQERMIGSKAPDGSRLAYSFTGQWAPRVGVTVDPFGKGRTKAYYNFGRFFEYLPLDLAERSLSTELDFRSGRFAPEFTVDSSGNRRVKLNQFGTVTPVVDAAHLLSGAANGTGGGLTLSGPATNPILPGTKLGYADEHVIGFEQQLPHNLVVSVRYIDRRLKRIVEDAALVSLESAALFGQAYFIGNISAKLDAAVNPIGFKYATGAPRPSQCDPSLDVKGVTDLFGNNLGNICYATNGKNGQPAGNFGGDGVPDGFPDPVHNYRAVEIELNKRFSNNWQLLTNWRIASLRGNFEGHFRNDNNQTDPGISSLFDFVNGDFDLLKDQFASGPLNTDRRHVVNLYGSYAFGQQGWAKTLKGLNLGTGIHMESGVPLSEYYGNPAYLNSGEIPIGGRGKLGRTPFYTRLDLHVDYPWQLTERAKFVFVADFFNVTNTQKVLLSDQLRESTSGQLNPDFGKPFATTTNLRIGYRPPFNMRLGVRFEF